jgi:beta-lactamase regulating signal transducer with metallopeptidase domain
VITAFAVPFLVSVGIAFLAPFAARGLPARAAVWLLTTAAAAAAVGIWVSIGAVVAATFGQSPDIASAGHWAPQVVRHSAPFPFAMCVAVVVVATPIAVRALFSTGADIRRLLRAWSVCRDAPDTLIVLPDTTNYAYAIPGWPGRIVTSSALLRALDPRQRRAVLAHEQAHLDAHHELYLIVAKFCASANPLLLTVPRAVRLACERWADESAASVVGDRRTVAVAIARAGTATTAGLMTFAAGGSDVPARVSALLSPPAGRRAWVIEAAISCAVIGAAAAACWMYRDLDRIFDAASLRH